MKRSKVGPESLPVNPNLAALQVDLLSDIYLDTHSSTAQEKQVYDTF